MDLKERTTYRRRDEILVHIAGPLSNGRQGFWSIEGDHYTTDGRLWQMRRVSTPVGEPQRYEDYAVDADSSRCIVREETAPQHVKWWDGVVTERKLPGMARHAGAVG